MKILERMMKKVAVVLIISLLLFAPVSLQACQENQEMQNSCCCCGDLDENYKFNTTSKDACGCELNEKEQTENQPVIFTSQQNNIPENSPFLSKVEFNSKDFSQDFRGTHPHHFSQVSKGPPLYILHSSFII